MGIVEGSCGYRACGISFRGKFVLSRNLGYGGAPLSLGVKYLTMVARHCHLRSDSEPLCSTLSQEDRLWTILASQSH